VGVQVFERRVTEAFICTGAMGMKENLHVRRRVFERRAPEAEVGTPTGNRISSA
jgi:hypothetical protein